MRVWLIIKFFWDIKINLNYECIIIYLLLFASTINHFPSFFHNRYFLLANGTPQQEGKRVDDENKK